MSIWTSPEGLKFRVVPGKKGNGDRRLEVKTMLGWRAVHMETVWRMMFHFARNEERLYPNGQGARYWRERCDRVLRATSQYVLNELVAELEAEKAAARQRREAVR